MTKKGSIAVVIVLLVASCSSAASPTTTLESAPPTTTTTTAPTPTTVAPTTTTATPPTTASAETVGSPEAMRALIERVVVEEVGSDNVGPLSDVPSLSANDSDPLVALLSNIAFEDWAYKTFPDPAWAEVLAVPGSPAFFSYRTQLDSERNANVRWEDAGDPFTVVSAELLTDVPLDPAVLDEFPDDSVSFMIDTSRGPYRKVRIDTGEVVDDRPGWESIKLIVVVAPTGVGWQVYLSEVID